MPKSQLSSYCFSLLSLLCCSDPPPQSKSVGVFQLSCSVSSKIRGRPLHLHGEKGRSFKLGSLLVAPAVYWLESGWGWPCCDRGPASHRIHAALMIWQRGLCKGQSDHAAVNQNTKKKKVVCTYLLPVSSLLLTSLQLGHTILLVLVDLWKQRAAVLSLALVVVVLKFSCSFALERKWKEVGNCFPSFFFLCLPPQYFTDIIWAGLLLAETWLLLTGAHQPHSS